MVFCELDLVDGKPVAAASEGEIHFTVINLHSGSTVINSISTMQRRRRDLLQPANTEYIYVHIK